MGLDTNDGDEKVLNSDVFLATISSLSDVTAKYLKLTGGLMSIETLLALKEVGRASFLVNFIASNLPIESKKKQQLLMERDIRKRASKVLVEQIKCLQVEELKSNIQRKAKE